jgi:hypothetical protein
MLARNTYPKSYIAACRARVLSQVEDFRKLAAAIKHAGAKGPALDRSFEALEVAFFNDMVIVLDGYFVHRARGLEKKDGNPLNEVRVLAQSMMENGERMMEDDSVKMVPATSILKHEVGDMLRLREEDFVLLAKAFFADLEKKFAE